MPTYRKRAKNPKSQPVPPGQGVMMLRRAKPKPWRWSDHTPTEVVEWAKTHRPFILAEQKSAQEDLVNAISVCPRGMEISPLTLKVLKLRISMLTYALNGDREMFRKKADRCLEVLGEELDELMFGDRFKDGCCQYLSVKGESDHAGAVVTDWVNGKETLPGHQDENVRRIAEQNAFFHKRWGADGEMSVYECYAKYWKFFRTNE